MSNNSIILTSLDFDTLKDNLKTYLRSQSQFTDYNFDGSNINVLLDILSYNSYLNAFYLNMVMNESFLDSAQIRGSVISHAKSLNYTPRSMKSAASNIRVVFSQGGADSLTIPAQTKFIGRNSNGTYTFTTNSALVIYPASGSFTSNLDIFEGSFVSEAFIMDYGIEAQKFIISNPNVDTDSLTVTVSENNGQTNTNFTKTTSLYDITATSNVYFLQATSNSSYEIVFGDNVFGRKPLNNSTILLNYRISNGTDGNGATNFTIVDAIGSITSISSTASSGGANAESIESIRYNAPRHFQTQERAITTDDFRNIVLTNFTDIKSCHVFGGESMSNGVNFGTVFVSPVTYSGASVSASQRASIESFLSRRCTLGIRPRIIDPDYLYLDVNLNVKFNPNATTITAAGIQQLVANTIQTYNDDYLEDFDTEFKFSRFEEFINDADNSISSTETKVIMKKILSPELSKEIYLGVDYKNPITPASVVSSKFNVAGRIYQFTDYNPNNNTFQVTQSERNGSVITNTSSILYLKDTTDVGYETYTNYGDINYSRGTISVNQISITDFHDSAGIIFYAEPLNQDVKSYNNDVILIDVANGITINVVAI